MTIVLKSFTLILVVFLAHCKTKKVEQPIHKHTNSLISESSPYLLQHAHNPVNWKAWNTANLDEAKKLNKPILISIGYSSCHWCHVMEHESFEDEEVAAYMNENYYCIKVDREERPDVDQIYMTAANIITGSGGWPLNCFALPDGRPFHAGTYYPKQGWLKLLATVNNQYTTNREKLEDYATRLTQGIKMQETAISDNPAQKLDFEMLKTAVSGWKDNWDMREGGINKAPKFPMPSNYQFLLPYSYFTQEAQVTKFIEHSLTKMALGGIYDQIGGGFSRYSTDALWKAPHFEKMLYDNGQLLSVYSKAYTKFNNPLYLKVVNQSIEWMEREMLDKSGLFYSALDADSEGEEGKYYVWTEPELKTVLGSDFEFTKNYYQIGNKALWEHENNILLRQVDNAAFAKQNNLDVHKVEEKIDAINAKLLAVRAKRIAPGLDDKCLTSWNGLAITGLCEAYKVTQNPKHKKLATNALDALLKNQLHQNALWHTYKNGKATINGMLEDYAFTALACLSVYQITGNHTYAERAKAITEAAIAKFYDAEKEFFYFNVDNELIVRTTEVYDNVIPSTNSAMANLLVDLGLLYGNNGYLQLAENIIGKVQKNISNYPGGHSNWAVAHLKLSKPYYEIAVTGPNAEALANQLNGMFIPNTVIYFSSSESEVPLFKGRYNANKTLLFICKKGMCNLPVSSIFEALKIVKNE